VSHFSSSIVYLSNQRMQAPCVHHVSGDRESIVCRAWPIKSLQPGGAVLQWTTNGFPGRDFAHQLGRDITVDGRAAKLTMDSGLCRRIGADREVTVIVSRKPPDNWYELDACFRDPGAGTGVVDVLALLRSVHISGP
jgi:hypothetical protein